MASYFSDLWKKLIIGRPPELFAKKGDEKTLDNFIPKSESDFLEYAELISHKPRPYELPLYRITKSVNEGSMTSLKAAMQKRSPLRSRAIPNEKLKAEKEANAGKKKIGVKKKQLLVDRPDVNAYDAVDDYDFDETSLVHVFSKRKKRGQRG
ncbi:hypothetical protein Patl1_19555 [Pistacia atlantica]|uniref:Uncharacterized protein n=1 Tax=Pistacia atlantica TaxID=434234 RepID=A0ACC1C2N1_9ROSI|nr:hypothetical protein Patl1_19555 [Pistacia atlantica]